MYQDDLDDLLPALPTRQNALPSFNDPEEDPFSNPFGGGSDPWASFGKTSDTYNDWNPNVFADETSQKPHASLGQTSAPSSPQAQRVVNDVNDDHQSHETKQTSSERDGFDVTTPRNENQSAVEPANATPESATTIGIVDPLDAALSNVEEAPAHVPVIQRKLPLVIKETTAESPLVTPVPKSESGSLETPTAMTNQPAAPSTNTEEDGEAKEPSTPTLPTADSATSEIPPTVVATPSNILDVPTSTSTDEPSPASPSDASITISTSEVAQVTPAHSHISSRDPSSSDVERQSFMDKVVVSPLERTPSMPPNPLDRNFSAPVLGAAALDSGGWGDGWSTDNMSHSFPVPGASVGQSEQQDGERAAATEEEEDPDDNVPLAQSLSMSKPPPPVAMYVISVGDPQKIGDPISAHIVYTVTTKTNNPNYKKSQFSVLRRYSDFVWLYDTLCANNPGVIVPPIPEKNSLGRFQDAFVQARRLALNKCIQKTANHPGLCHDKDLQLFLESDNFALDIKHRRTEEGGGLLSFLSNTVASTRFYETDEWFETKKVYLDGLENQLRGLIRSMEAVAKQRTESSQALAELADTLEALSTSDISQQLSSSFSHLATVQRKAKQIQDEQANQDVVTFAGTVEEYGRMIGSVRLAFASRVKCYGQWQNAENDLRRVRTAHEKARKQSKTPERLHYHIQEVADAERKVSHAKSEFERVTKLVKIELHRFDMERVEDFKKSLEAFLEGMIRRQKELINAWEEYQASLLQKSGANPVNREDVASTA
ncbi:related to vacuolar protein sorting-associated protein vps5 [Serendipita indica DSM 11827]|uniref:Related to vacuolar protein sorting-associated protein vps5 n=1 Tax=Serendipita indica (strain DSM 11827) TaxID=1109443 RepID=G4TVL7_SERID|nr:related to vacuolar protein sorting-associated protein vps5 [Serendipita indica DSM 11827]